MSLKVWSATHSRTVFQRKALALAIAGSVAIAFSGGAFAQAITGTIHGTAPAQAGEAVQITSAAGFNRLVPVGPNGQYSIVVPVGVYTVTLRQHGRVIKSRTNVTPAAGGASNVSFTGSTASGNVQTLSAVNVSANAIPAIDVSTTTQATTFTRQELDRLPIAQSAQDIALLSPGVLSGAASLGGNPVNGSSFLTVGGASTAENAYYIDGMNVSNFENGQGNTVVLPYFAIQQQQTMTSGYSAKYGRSIGGVVSQIGRGGSNDWHFGVRAIWSPATLQANDKNWYYNNPFYTAANNPPGAFTPSLAKGQLAQYRKANTGWNAIYDAYVSGPIIKDKLFFFLGVEKDQSKFSSVGGGQTGGSIQTPVNEFTKQSSPKIYAKINWNINDNNFLTLTGLQSSFNTWTNVYNFDYNTLQTGSLLSQTPPTKNLFRMWVLNYTSYISNNLTLNAMFGKTRGENFTLLSPEVTDPNGLPAMLGGCTSQGVCPTNSQPTYNYVEPGSQVRSMNYRVSLSYTWHHNDFSVGIDNIQTWDMQDGQNVSGPGYGWLYEAADPASALSGTLDQPQIAPWVANPNFNGLDPTGDVAIKYIFDDPASIRVAQRAEYIEDRWQVTPNLLLNLGLRNDQFTNYNPAGVPYINLHKPQWAPRLGFSWNVLGDSTFKVFGNAGRYYIALPASVALRDGGAPQFTEQFFQYNGIDANGLPQNLVAIPQNNSNHPNVGVSANNEYGEVLNPQVVSATNIRAEYSDNFVLGVDKEFNFLGTKWVAGATGKYNKLGRIVDDWGNQSALCELAMAQGVAYAGSTAAEQMGSCLGITDGSLLFNPGLTNDFNVMGSDGKLHKVVVTPKDQGFPAVKRRYYSLDLSLQHPYDGKWFGKIDLVWSRLYGNEEGPVDSIIGQAQASVSATEAWDFPQLMEGSNGLLPNDQKWQLISYGEYTINPEWNVGGTLLVGSGHPVTCLGYYGAAQSDPLGYANGFGGAYHYCLGHIDPPGSGAPGSSAMTPWTEQLNLNVQYRPAFADHKLAFVAQVFNVFNQQRVTQYYYGIGQSASPYPYYLSPYGAEPPRTVQLEVRYDF